MEEFLTGRIMPQATYPGEPVGGLPDLRSPAHPNKGSDTDDYLEVTPAEAEWTLDVLDDVFDYFVRPAIERARKANLAAKLAGLGPDPPRRKPPRS